MKKIKVLIVDDSSFMRYKIRQILESDVAIEVVGEARNGKEAMDLILQLKPDVVTLDVEMPEMGGVEALQEIMSNHPLPVVMVSQHTQAGAEVTLRCLQLGAVDFISKPPPTSSRFLRDLLLSKVKASAGANVRLLTTPPGEKMQPGVCSSPRSEGKIVVIGCSTGGPRALHDLLPVFPANTPAPFLVIQHMPKGFTETFASRMNDKCRMKVKEAEEGELLRDGVIYIAPGGYHLEVTPQRSVRLSDSPHVNSVRPSVDVTLHSLAPHFGKVTIVAILTGMGRDGTRGARAIRKAGGKIIAQDEKSCVVYGMPKTIVEEELHDEEAPLSGIATCILQYLHCHGR